MLPGRVPEPCAPCRDCVRHLPKRRTLLSVSPGAGAAATFPTTKAIAPARPAARAGRSRRKDTICKFLNVNFGSLDQVSEAFFARKEGTEGPFKQQSRQSILPD